jgi:HlyD family secretion protein
MTERRWSWLPRRLWQGFKILLVAVIIAGVVYWLKFAPVSVAEHQVGTGEIVAEVMGTGTLEAHYKSTVSPRISGRLQEVLADMGDVVTAGQVLARLDDVELRPQVEMAEASVAVAKATLDRLEADRSQATAVLEQTTADHKRALALLPKSAISQTDADKATAEWKTAQAGVARSEAAMIEARKQLIAAERNLAYRKALLDDTVVVAPVDGLIVQRQRDPGDIAVPGSAVLSLISTKELWVTAWVDETEMSRVAVGQPARVVFRSEARKNYRGEVARLGRQADRETREFPVDVRVLELPKTWAIGQRAEVYVETGRKTEAIVLPTKYILWRDGTPGVLVRMADRAAWRGLTLGLAGMELAEVASGLEPGDTVVVPADGKNTSIEGRRISVK